ncbi:MAG: zinc ribbon domain-containing protein [Planctomycetaceae bacterium]|nr:zinc ribbon domain-containing protein [Planctomycetaceae bacterium]
MPLYEYHCEACDANVEVLVRNSAEKPECPECASAKLTKLLSVPAGHVAGGSSASALPMMPPGGCGKPQCGMGGCESRR